VTTTKRPAKPTVPAPRTIEEVCQELEERLAVYEQERSLFQRLVTIAKHNGAVIDSAAQGLVLDRIARDANEARSHAAEEIRRIVQAER
jgi:hypothetical protein